MTLVGFLNFNIGTVIRWILVERPCCLQALQHNWVRISSKQLDIYTSCLYICPTTIFADSSSNLNHWILSNLSLYRCQNLGAFHIASEHKHLDLHCLVSAGIRGLPVVIPGDCPGRVLGLWQRRRPLPQKSHQRRCSEAQRLLLYSRLSVYVLVILWCRVLGCEDC